MAAILLFHQTFSLQNLSVSDSHCQIIIINPQTYQTMNGNTYVYITRAIKQSTCLINRQHKMHATYPYYSSLHSRAGTE